VLRMSPWCRCVINASCHALDIRKREGWLGAFSRFTGCWVPREREERTSLPRRERQTPARALKPLSDETRKSSRAYPISFPKHWHCNMSRRALEITLYLGSRTDCESCDRQETQLYDSLSTIQPSAFCRSLRPHVGVPLFNKILDVQLYDKSWFSTASIPLS
jgi:hypothetical protein